MHAITIFLILLFNYSAYLFSLLLRNFNPLVCSSLGSIPKFIISKHPFILREFLLTLLSLLCLIFALLISSFLFLIFLESWSEFYFVILIFTLHIFLSLTSLNHSESWFLLLLIHFDLIRARVRILILLSTHLINHYHFYNYILFIEILRPY